MKDKYARVKVREKAEGRDVKIGSDLKPRISDSLLEKWQSLLDLSAGIANVPAALIMKLNKDSIEVFLKSDTPDNPYETGEKADLKYGLYCETVIGTQEKLLVPDARRDPLWKHHNPDIALNMIAYLGFPVNWPDGEVFGTICLLDNKENPFSNYHTEFLGRIRENIEKDLELLLTNWKLSERLKETHCLYQINRLFEKNIDDIEALADAMLSLIPPAMHHPALACSRLILDGKAYLSKHFRETPWKLSGNLHINNAVRGRLEIFYKEEMPSAHKGPFLKEETQLLKAITRNLGQYLSRKETEKAMIRSRDDLRITLNSIGDAVIATDSAGRVNGINPVASELTGFSPAEAEGKPLQKIFRIVNAKTGKSVENPVKKVLKHGDIVGLANHTELISRNGNTYQIADSGSPIRNDEGDITGVVLVFRDISEDYRIRQALIESENKFRSLVDQAAEMLFLHDTKGNIIDVNKAAETHTGYTKAQLTQMNITDIDPLASERRDMKYYWKRSLSSDQAIRFESTHQRKDGSVYPAEITVSRVQLSGGNYILALARNITERKKAEKELKESEEKYRLIVENANDGIEITQNDRIIFTNSRFADMLGYTVEELKDTRFSQIFTASAKKALYERHEKRRAGIPLDDHYETRFRKKDGTKIDVSVNYEIIDYRGQPATFAIIRDVTEEKKAEKALISSEKKYRMLFETMSQGVVYQDAKGKIFSANPAAQRVLGLTLDQMKGRTSVDARWKAVDENRNPLPGRKHPAMVALSTGKKVENFIQGIFNPQLNDYVWLMVNSIPLFRKNGDRPYQVYSTFLDITKERKAELALQESQRQFNVMIDNLNGVVYRCLNDRYWTMEYMSDAIREITGYPADDFIGNAKRAYVTVIAEEDRKRIRSEINTAVKAKRRFTVEYRIRTSNGEIRWVWERGRAVFRKNNTTILEGFIVDISERKASELELLKAKQKAEESDRLKSAFLANMSHEIRTPMNSIMGFLSLLQEPELSGEKKDSYINIVKQSSTRLLNTINDIIEIAKIESGYVKIFPEEISISVLLEYFYDFFKPEADKKGLSLRVKDTVDKSTDVLRTDRNKLESILNNFMDNALKFTREGFIEIGAGREKDRIVFHVSDSGPGIPADRQEAIFNRFVQADMGINRSHEGSGLGLSISRAYAKMLGGEIFVRSRSGEGSTFYFTLPSGNASAGVMKSQEKAPPAKRPGKKKKACILVAEDDDASFIYTEAVLQAENFTVVRAANGEEAVRHCRENPDIGLVLMDLKMPRMNGYTATRKIREFDRKIPVIAQTAYALQGDEKKALAAGCDHYLTKPLTSKALLKCIWKYL